MVPVYAQLMRDGAAETYRFHVSVLVPGTSLPTQDARVNDSFASRLGRRRAMTGMGHLHPYVTSSATDCRAPKPAVPLSWVERVKPSTSTLIQTRMRVSPDCFPSSRPGRDRERGTAMIYAGRFILYRDRWCAAEGRRSDGHPVPQALHFSNTEHCENLRQIPGASGPLSRVREAGPPRTKEFDFGPLRLELVRQAA